MWNRCKCNLECKKLRKQRSKPESKWIRRPYGNTSVVFVHGILSNSIKCWKNSNGTYWPKLLKDEPELNSIGIYVFNYKSGVDSGTFDLEDIVKSLKNRFDVDGINTNQNVIFVCHSMGGVVVRKLIIESEQELINRKIKIGLFLVASPSLGSRYANLLYPLIKLFGNQQAETLYFIKNQQLSTIHDGFLSWKLRHESEIDGKELVEDTLTQNKIINFLISTQIVERSSANIYFPDYVKIPDADHSSIAKPNNNRAEQHITLINFIKKICSDNSQSVLSKIDISEDAPLAVFEKLSKIKNLKFPPLWYNCLEDRDKRAMNRFRFAIEDSDESWFIPTVHISWNKDAQERYALEDKMNDLASYKDIYALLEDVKKFDQEAIITWYGDRVPFKKTVDNSEYSEEQQVHHIFV